MVDKLNTKFNPLKAGDTRALMFPSAARSSVYDTKREIKEYQEVKARRQFIKRRVKLVKSGWRNGIVGVEMPNEEGNGEQSQLYKSNYD